MSTANTNPHRRCTKLRVSAPSQFDEEARKPHSDSKDQTIGENGRRIDGRKRRSRREGERRERGHAEAGREAGRVEGDDRNQREECKGTSAAWWQKLLCCTDTAVKEPAADCTQTKSNVDKRIQSLNSEGSCPRKQKPVHETTDGGRKREKPKRNVTTGECRGPRNTTKDHGLQKGTTDGSFARYTVFHDFSEHKESSIPRPPQTEKPKRRRNNRHFSTHERKDTGRVPSEAFCDVCEQFKDQPHAKQSCRHDEKVRQGEKKTVEEKNQDNQNHPEKSNINIIFKLPSKMFNTCCRSSKYLPVVPMCHTNLTQDEFDYIKLCVATEEAIAKPLPCASNRKVYDYWLKKYGIALTGLLLPDSSDIETSDEEEERQQKENLTTGKVKIVPSYVDRDRPSTTVDSVKDDKLPSSGKIQSDGDKRTEETSKQIEEDYPSKDKVGFQQRLILTRQNVSQISIFSESVRDEKCEEKETSQKQDAQAQTEVKTNQDDLVFSFVRSVTGYLDRSSPDKGQTQKQECSECLKRANVTRGIMLESPVSTRDTSTQTAEQLREESHIVKDEATLTSLSPTTTRESDITIRLLQILEGQLKQRPFQPTDEEKIQRKNGQKVKTTHEKVSVKPLPKTEPQEILAVMCPSSESLSSNSEIEVFGTTTQHISVEEQSIKDSTASSQDRQTKDLSSETYSTDEKTTYQIVRQEKRELWDESEVQRQVTFDTDVPMTKAQKATFPPKDEGSHIHLAQSLGSSSKPEKIAEKPKRLIDTMPPPVLSCRGFLGSSVNQKGKAVASAQGSLKPTQELVTPVTSGTLPSHHAPLPPQLPPLTVPTQKLSMTNDDPRMGVEHQGKLIHQPAPPSHEVAERLAASDHQRHRQLTPIEVPVTSESNNISAEGISPLAVGVLPSRRSMQLAPLSSLVGSASSTNSLQSSRNFDFGRPSRFGQLSPLSGAKEDNMSKKPRGKKKKKNKKKAPERMTTSDPADQDTVRFPVQNINVAEEDQYMSARRLRDTDEQPLRPRYPLHAPVPPHHLPHPGRARLQPIARQPNLSEVRRRVSAPSAHKPLTGLRRGKKETLNIAQNVTMLRQKREEPEKKGFLEPILPREKLERNDENNEEDHEMFYDPRVFPFHGFVPPELMEEYVEYPIPEELLYREQLSHEHRFHGMSTHHGFPTRKEYFDTSQMAHYQLAEDLSEMEDPGLVLVDDDELGLDTVLALPPTRQKFWDSDFRC